MDKISTKVISGVIINIIPFHVTPSQFQNFIEENMELWGSKNVLWDARTLEDIDVNHLKSQDFLDSFRILKESKPDRKYAIVVSSGEQIEELIQFTAFLRSLGFKSNVECFEHVDDALKWAMD